MIRTHRTLLFAALAWCLAHSCQAQQERPSPPAAAEGVGELEAITVTGTLLHTTPDEVAIPVVTLDAQMMEHAGVDSNALEMLRKTISAFAGRSNAGDSNANNDSLRTGGGATRP
jgi:iron complex outermembrane receptor protein